MKQGAPAGAHGVGTRAASRWNGAGKRPRHVCSGYRLLQRTKSSGICYPSRFYSTLGESCRNRPNSPGGPHASLLVDRAASARATKRYRRGLPGMDVSIHGHVHPMASSAGNLEARSLGHPRASRGPWPAWIWCSVFTCPSGRLEAHHRLYFTRMTSDKIPVLVSRTGCVHRHTPGDRDYVVTDSFRCPTDVEYHAVYPRSLPR